MFRVSRWLCHANVCVLFLFWYNMWRNYVCSGHWLNYFLLPERAVHASAKSIFILCLCVFMSAESTGTTIYDSLGRQYGPLFGLSFLDVNASLCLHWLLAQLFPATMVSGMGHCSVYCSLMSMFLDCRGHWHNYFMQPG